MTKLVTFGLDAETDDLILDPLTERSAADEILGRGPDPSWRRRGPRPPTFGLVEGGDPFDPREVGWVAVVGKGDPARKRIVDAVRPLAEHRVGDADWGPIEYELGTTELDFVRDELTSREPVPRYVLLAGSPQFLPFALQASLATSWYVGRLDFSTVANGDETQDIDRLTKHVQRLCADADSGAEQADRGPTTRVLMWATSGSRRDPTFYSRHILAGKLAAHIEAKKNQFSLTSLFDADATRDRLLETLATARPALLFTASHGVGAKLEAGVDLQASVNGALVGQDRNRFTAADLPPADEPFVEGGVVFQFACFGYGTPASSGYTHWSPDVKKYEAPFELVSALPKAALAHPRGPFGYIAHADYALLHAFANAATPGWEAPKTIAGRLGGFRAVVNEILNARPIGAALTPMGAQLGLFNNDLADQWDRAQASGVSPSTAANLVDKFMRRNDARFYLLLGDPAATPRIQTA